MKTIHKLLRAVVLAAGALAVTASGAWAQNFQFNEEDIVLGIRATSGTGSTKNLFWNLGSSTAIRSGGAAAVNTGNVFADLNSTFGADWFTRTDLWFGAFGNLSPFADDPVVNGDPGRTVYISKAANSGPGSSTTWSGYTGNALGGAAINYSGLRDFLPTLTATASGAAILDQTANPVEWNNSWSKWNPFLGEGQAAAFEFFAGGLQQSFNTDGVTPFIDIQRILATTDGANPTGPVGSGTYVTSIGIDSAGNITAVPEPSTYALLTLAAAGLGAHVIRRRRKNS